MANKGNKDRIQNLTFLGDEWLNAKRGLVIAFIIVAIQIALGGWVSANYAGLSCIGFPRCNGQWWPQFNLLQAFNFFSPLGVNYEGGALENAARITIQMVHRVGAVVTGIYLLIFTLWLWFRMKHTLLCKQVLLIMILISLQFTLGVINVTKLLPLPNAVAHNGVAALLLLSLISLWYKLTYPHQLKRTG